MTAGSISRGRGEDGPRAALEHREALGLSGEQVGRLEAIEEKAAEARRSAMERERFDENAARSAFARLGDLHTDMGVAMLRARHETRAVLTPEQRQKLPRGGMGMHGMTGGLHGMDGMMDDMRDCPIMNGMGGMPMNGAETKSTHP